MVGSGQLSFRFTMQKDEVVSRPVFGVIATDLGVSTGICLFHGFAEELRKSKLTELNSFASIETFTSAPVRSAEDETALCWHIVERAEDWAAENGIDEVIWATEEFVLRPGQRGMKREVLAPVRLAAGLRVACGATVWGFSPSDSKGVMTDARLKYAGLWVRGRDHERDAVRIALMAWRRWAGLP